MIRIGVVQCAFLRSRALGDLDVADAYQPWPALDRMTNTRIEMAMHTCLEYLHGFDCLVHLKGYSGELRQGKVRYPVAYGTLR